jgi:glyoxylase-like metal-dependent hydrolase (beta-lactamase superfamily II)
MFGNVPFAMWSKHHKPDEKYRIRLSLRVLYFEGDGRRVLVDTGTGHLWGAKEEAIFKVEAAPIPPVLQGLRDAGIDSDSITDVILTHLHFDHAGGVTMRGANGEPVLTFPHALHHLQTRNLETAMNPNAREKASYLPHHWKPLLRGRLQLHDGDAEILPGVFASASNGHTNGLQVIRVGEGSDAFVFPADMIPLTQHVHVPWTLGYDLWVEQLMREKESLLRDAHEQGYQLVLEHDPHRAVVRVGRDKGRFFALDETGGALPQ